MADPGGSFKSGARIFIPVTLKNNLSQQFQVYIPLTGIYEEMWRKCCGKTFSPSGQNLNKIKECPRIQQWLFAS